MLQPYKIAMNFEDTSDFKGLGLIAAALSGRALPFQPSPLSMIIGQGVTAEFGL